MYTNGFAYTGEDNNVDINTRHAWTVAKIDGNWIPLDATWNFFNGKLPLSHIFRYYGEKFRETKAQWGLFANSKKEMEDILGANPPINLEIKAINFISRELEDDNEGDFELTLDNNTTKNIIISILVVAIFAVIIVIIVLFKKRKGKNKKDSELNISLSIN